VHVLHSQAAKPSHSFFIEKRSLTRRRASLLIVQSLIGLGLLAVWALAVDLSDVWQTLAQARWPIVIAAAMISVCSSFVRAARWRLILRPVARVPLWEIWLITLVSSLVNFVIPVRSGELARAVLLKQRRRVPMSASLPTVAIDRSFDLLAVLLLGALGAAIGIRLDPRLTMVLALGGVLMLVFAALVIVAIASGDWAVRLAERLFPPQLGVALRERSLGVLKGVIAGFTAIGRRPADIFRLLMLSLAASLLDAAMFYCLFFSLGAILPPSVVITGYAVYVLTFIIPGAPGYIGSAEAFGSLVFGSLGVAPALAASTIVLGHALNALFLAITGGLSIWLLGLKPSETVRSLSSAKIEEPGLETENVIGP